MCSLCQSGTVKLIGCALISCVACTAKQMEIGPRTIPKSKEMRPAMDRARAAMALPLVSLTTTPWGEPSGAPENFGVLADARTVEAAGVDMMRGYCC
jgi:hypothetical protein